MRDALPDELVVLIVSHLRNDANTLCSLARTSAFFQHECEKHIYSEIWLLSTGHLRTILGAFARRPERIASVETLNIVYNFHHGIGTTLEERTRFNECVGKMTALRRWHVESPFDNFKWDSEGGQDWVECDMEIFRTALEAASLKAGGESLTKSVHVGLSKLEQLTIHSHGISTDFWDLDGFHCLFRHPTLRSLHVSCFVLPEDLPALGPYTKSTALTTLVFDECVLTPKSLECILRTPKNLTCLTLGENVYNDRRSMTHFPRLTERPDASLEALTAVAHSLQSLTHLDPMWKRTYGNMYKQRSMNGNGLRDFHHLKFLDVDPSSFLHQFVMSQMQAPPHLETFRIHHALMKYFEDRNGSLFDLFEELPSFEPYTALASLRTLEFAQAASMESHMTRSDHICREAALRERHEYAYRLSKRGVNMRMYLEASWKLGLMPPYLYGEQKPELVCVYDASQVGFRRHLENLTDENVDNSSTPRSTLDGASYQVSSEVPQYVDPTTHREGNKEPPETDQLNRKDIVALAHEVGRSIVLVIRRMNALEDDESSHNSINISDDDDDDIDLMGQDDVDFWYEVDDLYDEDEDIDFESSEDE